jgi:DNA polymerase III alpha subunit (gram-positive type)
MPKPSFIVLDTETGGLHARFNPLLSIAILIADEAASELDGHGERIRPPDNCLLQIPLPQDMFNEKTWNPRTDHWLNLTTGEKVEASFKPLMSIAAKAAEINGFVKPGPDGKWDMTSFRDWTDNTRPLAAVENTYRQFIRQGFGDSVDAVKVRTMAYNGKFDKDYVETHMPALYSDLNPQWADPCEMAKFFVQARTPGIKKGWKLTQMAKEAGFDEHKAHDAYGDCQACLTVFRWLRSQGQPSRWS